LPRQIVADEGDTFEGRGALFGHSIVLFIHSE
jgi:hypothetical protein